MPTYWSKSLIPTLRETPAEAEVPSHQWMLRAGYIRKLGSGVYDYLPLGRRSLQRAMTIIREEMAAAGAEEVLLPALVPIDLYKQTGRDAAYGDNLFRLKDRHGREQTLGPTHEEIITELMMGYTQSHRDLPRTLFQIQTKFRDEFRPRFGVLRSREFLMKDAYSFHLHVDGPPGSGGLDETYQKQYDAYCRIFTRCGFPYEIVEAESGPIGGSASHEFMILTPTGEDTILKSDKGNYAANVEKCAIGERPVGSAFTSGGAAQPRVAPPTGDLEKVHTPGCPGIDDVSKLLKVKPKHMLKTLVCRNDDGWVLAVVRGDHELNAGKLKAQLADDRAAREAGFVIGFVGPHAILGRGDARLVVDADVTADQFWVTGANESDHHVKHFDWRRDLLDQLTGDRRSQVIVADIRNALDGDPSPKNDGGILRGHKAIEVGHVFKLGTKYSDAMGFSVLNEKNERQSVIMGCYGIGVNRILAAAIERPGGHDASGIIWPRALAPYDVLITVLKHEGKAAELACVFAEAFEAAGYEVLIDDRDERPGPKFKDADMIGIPLRLTLGEKGLANSEVEIKARNGSNGPSGGKGESIAVDAAMPRCLDLLKAL
jgi:prolyl-tRNA synthetase